MRTSGLFIGGLGVFVPEPVSVESAVEQGWCSTDEATLHGMSGAAVAGEIPAPEMALSAARDAIAAAGGREADVGMLLYCDMWHQGPDGWLPHYFLQRHLVGGQVVAMELRHDANSMFSALELAATYDRAERPDVLVVAADNFGTPRFDRWRSPVLFGDGAVALVLKRGQGVAQVLSVGSSAVPELEEGSRYGEPMFPPGATTGARLDWAARDDGFVGMASERTDLRTALLTTEKMMLQLASRIVAEAGISFDDIVRAAFTNLAPDSIEHRWLETMRMPMARTTWDYSRGVGQLGAGGPFAALHHLLDTGQVGSGDHVLLGAVGNGVTASCAVVRVL
ncbi:ketoacyl-ACP synthase III family protein [Nonomuraea sp. SYSU D8015]|uniref:ketoacyl-ACP synthase III family protein n=1 Tax=Nonomuraea sp. SYSU D8015 TaxID=2593644 RepID=UPI001CB7280D|nr:ketoacyl-ACP synthase III family protein [Nonomuraea sp. SYSU D8015]